MMPFYVDSTQAISEMKNDLISAKDLKDHEKIPIKVSNQDKVKAYK
jgi:hypothetical protein